MEFGTKIKWCIFIFGIAHHMTSGCEISYNDCYIDVYCSYQYLYSNPVNVNDKITCPDSLYVDNEYYSPLRFKIASGDEYLSILQELNTYGGKDLIVSLDMADNQLKIIPDFYKMDNLKFLNLSNNHLHFAKLFNQAELKALESIDLSHNYISSIEVDDSQYVYRSIQKLNLSYNLLSNIPGGIFVQFKYLKYLDLSHNNIAGINPYTFEGLKNLKYLYLSNNNISDIHLSLYRFSNLEELYLDNNNIENLSVHDFETLRNLQTLSFDFNKINSIQKDTFNNTESLTVLKLQHNLIRHIHKDAFLSTNNLMTIDLSNNLIENLPKDLFKNKNLTSFSINGNNLKGAISKGIFEGLHFITELDVSYQAVTAIEEFAFLGLAKLTTLLLNNNEIRTISKHSFNSLTCLRELDLSNNLIVSMDFNKGDLISLEIFNLGNNFINQILHKHIQGLNSLRFLDVSNNNITELESTSFQCVGSIETLQLFNNPISSPLLNKIFGGLHLVPDLNLSHTLITSIHNGSFSGMVQLNDLNISRSSVNKLEYHAFINTGRIKSLDLSFNKLSDFFVDGNDLKNLTNLYLNNNVILQISKYVFSHMSNLNKIILSFNLIQSIDDKCFANQANSMGNLTKLVMRSNDNSKTSENTSILKWLDLSFNNISVIQHGTFKDNILLYHLNLSHNSLTSLKYGIFRGLTNLNLLDVSYNRIHDIKEERFYDTPNLKVLIADYNKITYVSFYNGINFLSIGHNPLSCEKVVTLKLLRKFEVSAICIDESNADNVDGIVCNYYDIRELKIHTTQFNSTNSKIIRVDAQNKLLNLSENTESKMTTDLNNTILYLLKDSFNKINKYAIDQTVNLNDIKTEISNNFNRTNSLLDNIFKALLNFRSLQNNPISDRDSEANIEQKKDIITYYKPNNTMVGNHSNLHKKISDKELPLFNFSSLEDLDIGKIISEQIKKNDTLN